MYVNVDTSFIKFLCEFMRNNNLSCSDKEYDALFTRWDEIVRAAHYAQFAKWHVPYVDDIGHSPISSAYRYTRVYSLLLAHLVCARMIREYTILIYLMNRSDKGAIQIGGLFESCTKHGIIACATEIRILFLHDYVYWLIGQFIVAYYAANGQHDLISSSSDYREGLVFMTSYPIEFG